MDKIIYFLPLYSDNREQLIDKCCKLQNKGQNFLYILPSRGALSSVRQSFLDKRGGLINSSIIMFDELERLLCREVLAESRIINSRVKEELLQESVEKNRDKLLYFKKLSSSMGFIRELSSLISRMKRECKTWEELIILSSSYANSPLSKKLQDIAMLYRAYEDIKKAKRLYDSEDISKLAIEEAAANPIWQSIDTIVIDGFINIDRVNKELIKTIAKQDRVNIYINLPYRNELLEPFLNSEINEELLALGFQLVTNETSQHKVAASLKELSLGLYSGEKCSSSCDGIVLRSFPCVEAEVREAARCIKKSLMEGMEPSHIALYVNNLDLYEKSITSIFSEYNIPHNLGRREKLINVRFVRELITDCTWLQEEDTIEKHLLKLEARLREEKEKINSTAEAMLLGSLTNTEAIYLRGYKGLQGIIALWRSQNYLLQQGNKIISREKFVEQMRQWVEEATVTLKKGFNTGVNILNTDLAKGIYFKEVYILGLNEGEVPKAAEKSVIFNGEEKRRLMEEGFTLRSGSYEQYREKIRFNLALASAEERLYLSCRNAGEKGEFAIPSSFMEEVCYLTSRSIVKYSMKDRFYKNFSELMSRRELEESCLVSYSEALYEGSITVEDLSCGLSSLCSKGDISSTLVEYHREYEEDFDSYEGMVGGAFLPQVSSFFTYSGSSFNGYFQCPFRYMLDNIFKLQELEEEEEEFSAIELGQLYHRVLAAYYKEADYWHSVNEKLLSEKYDEEYSKLRPLELPKLVLDTLKEKYYKILKDFIAADLTRLSGYEKLTGRVLRPYRLEWSLQNYDFLGIPLKGVVDRVDLEYEKVEGGLKPTGAYVIYDYKRKSSSSSPKNLKDIVSGRDCQLPIYYYLAEEQLKNILKLENIRCMGLLYMYVENLNKTAPKASGILLNEDKKALGYSRSEGISTPAFKVVVQQVQDLVKEALTNIKSGSFNYKPYCYHKESSFAYPCRYGNLCRYSKNKIRRGGI